jgi:CheY-like chemotaxis protein
LARCWWALPAAAARDEAVIRRCQSQISRLAEQAMDRALRGDAGGAARDLLAHGETTLNAKLLEMASQIARRHRDSVDDADALCARAAAVIQRSCRAGNLIAGIQRSGRSPGGLQVRGRAPRRRPVQQLDREVVTAHALVIDGNPMSRSVMVQNLREFGFGLVKHAARLQDAREALEAQALRRGAVRQPLRQQRRIRAGPAGRTAARADAAVLHGLHHGHGDATYQKVAEAAEAALDSYLIKPFSANTLFERLKEARQRKRVLKDIFDAMEQHDHDACRPTVPGALRAARPVLAVRGAHRRRAAAHAQAQRRSQAPVRRRGGSQGRALGPPGRGTCATG